MHININHIYIVSQIKYFTNIIKSGGIVWLPDSHLSEEKSKLFSTDSNLLLTVTLPRPGGN